LNGKFFRRRNDPAIRETRRKSAISVLARKVHAKSPAESPSGFPGEEERKKKARRRLRGEEKVGGGETPENETVLAASLLLSPSVSSSRPIIAIDCGEGTRGEPVLLVY